MVSKLIEGFETPLGMELLATVDFILAESPDARDNEQQLITKIHKWSQRKKEIMQPEYILIAYKRLIENSNYSYSTSVN